MCTTCITVEHMAKMIQIRNVPEKLHRTLKARAAAEGMSLSDYIKRDLERAAARPTFEEVDARIRARKPTNVKADTIVSIIREVRDS